MNLQSLLGFHGLESARWHEMQKKALGEARDEFEHEHSVKEGEAYD
jgi:hypothetical protein